MLVRLQVYAGQAFRISCFNLLLEIAAAAAPSGACKLAAAARLLQHLPAHMQGPGGELHVASRAWLTGEVSNGSRSGSTWLASSMEEMWQQYFSSSSNGACSSRQVVGSMNQQQQQQQEPHWQARPQDYTSWRNSCDTWLRVLLCCGDKLQPQATTAFSNLADKAEQLSSRPYLAPGTAEKVLVMLSVLLEGAEAAGRMAIEAGQQLPVLTTAAAGLAEVAAGPLSRCLELYSSCYRLNPADMAVAVSSSGSVTDAAGKAVGGFSRTGFGLSPAAWAAAARAEAAAQAAAAAALLLARHASGCWDVCGALDATASCSSSSCRGCVAPARRVLPVLLRLLGAMADVGEQLTGKPLPNVTVPEAAAEEALVVGLHVAAAAEQSRTSALKVCVAGVWAILQGLQLQDAAPTTGSTG